MPSFGKPDATGRSSGKRAGRTGKAHRPPKDQPWIWLTRELLASAAWRARSINTVRLIEFLLVEHMAHAGTENGNLKATYDQLVAFGLTRSAIRAATEEAEFLGLIRFKRGGRWVGTNQPSTYRLTFLPDRDSNPPTNEWKGKTERAISAWKQEQVQRLRARHSRRKKQIPSSTSRTTVVPLYELRDRKKGCTRRTNWQKTSHSDDCP